MSSQRLSLSPTVAPARLTRSLRPPRAGTTWEGLSNAPDEWDHPAAPAAQEKKSRAARAPAPVQKKRVAPVSKGIEKKKKAPRAAGLMKVPASPAAVEEEPEPSNEPYIVDSINPFAVLGHVTEAEEAAEEEAAAKKKATKPVEPPSEGGFSSTPIARRTRQAAKAIGGLLSQVVAAVSPMLERSAHAANRPSRLSRATMA